jgi:hypothetical protein
MYSICVHYRVCFNHLVGDIMTTLADKLMDEAMAEPVEGNTPEARAKVRWLQGYKTGKRVQLGRLLQYLDSLEIYNLESADHKAPFRLPYRELRDMILEQFR